MTRLARLDVLVLALLAGFASAAQAPKASPSPHDVTRYGVVYTVPRMQQVHVVRDREYGRGEARALLADFYYPEKPTASSKWPAVVFLNGIGDTTDESLKDWAIYRTWAQLVAAHGLVGVTMSAEPGRAKQSIESLFAHLGAHAGELSIDADRIATYAASANVSTALEVFGGASGSKVRAAVLYYGGGDALDLPQQLRVLAVIAGKDGAQMQEFARRLLAKAIDRGAPWTVAYDPLLPHAFDALDTSERSRRTVRDTVDFLVGALTAVPASAEPESKAREALMHTYANEPARAEAAYRELCARDAQDGEARIRLADALIRAGKPREALEWVEKGMALGYDGADAHHILAMSHQSARRWAEAIKSWRAAIERGRRNGIELANLGLAQLMTNDNVGGAKSYEEALSLGFPPGSPELPIAHYNLACAYARLGRVDDGIAQLGKALDRGFDDARLLRDDTDLAGLRGDKRFAELVARLNGR